ncbi:RsmF rRNA methyltransferase first C-terminal domain-containing protein [Pseudobutyrivibrio xylanivorans]|uniref:16S rRNA C967 or C1407 C5-methylase, RsmB/RsmF family n=1 Tax=Pseudobutyrivibrio xylanivorans DSM 14809 TaxID=1123012 RepID=A0A1M6CGI9_PSEXY|nr:RsmF rRNA methyltransferase first C-terminal domain-containing protein [Pseudobutyrivibrio xylanivorans]SHI60132.1 16S rRNA C967 or C1407 C5-methylase, RsmB/RsmF family [Pseudobutyrivibrio xylanivorans DSM 14809]
MDTSFLPIDFVNRMEQDLGPDFHAFLRSYEENKISALRFNPIKADDKAVETMSSMLTGKVDWSKNGYYYDETYRPGLHPYHAAGVYYIQDASAQLPVEMLAPVPGDICLDLCAAPGGKSTQIAGYLNGEGILVSNEPMKNRAKILSENVERLGIRNCIVTSEYPDKLADTFPEYFDKIMVDAPCSGEGMFRKNHDACDEWSLESVEMCADRQAEILDRAYEMLIPGGRMCYSTCTFAKLEDEEAVAAFISRHPDMILIEERRLWPHEVKGEGHYAALLEKADSDGRREECAADRAVISIKKVNKKIKEYFDFLRIDIPLDKCLPLEGRERSSGPQVRADRSGSGDKVGPKGSDEVLLYLLPDNCPDFSKLHVLRGGLFLGTLKKNRFEPSHALALALTRDEVKNSFDLPADGQDVQNYLRGQSVMADVQDGWTLITVDGYSVGWGKAVKGQIKNHYPKGLRLL